MGSSPPVAAGIRELLLRYIPVHHPDLHHA